MNTVLTLAGGQQARVLTKPRWWQVYAWWVWARSDRVTVTTIDGREIVLRIPRGSLR